MVDEIHDRTYQDGREQFHAGIDRLIEKLLAPFKVAQEIQFDAPWTRRSEGAGCA